MSPRVWVPGKPAPQGSKTAFRSGGKIQLRESSKTVGPWRDRVAYAAIDVLGVEHEPTRAAVVLNVRFVFTRPKSHLRVNGEPRGTAPRLPAGRPDLSKLVRAVEDALTGVAWHDDAQIVTLNVAKEYGNADGAEIVWSVIA